MNKDFITISVIVLAAIGLIIHFTCYEPELGNAMTLDGRQVTYTDENDGEDLIIKTDQSDYFNLGGNIVVYYSITNNSDQNQNIATVFCSNTKLLVSDRATLHDTAFSLVSAATKNLVDHEI